MVTCKDCLHHDVCRIAHYQGDERILKNSPCKHFLPTADVVERNKLNKLLESKYGDLENNRGCNVNGQWLSVAAIVEIIAQATKE